MVLEKNISNIGVNISNGGTGIESCSSLTDIFYEGNIEDWNAISLNKDKDFMETKLNFYSESEPIDEGNYWHYVERNPTKW